MSPWFEKMNTKESTDAELIDIVLGRHNLNNSSDAKKFLEEVFKAIKIGKDENEASNNALGQLRITNPVLIGEYNRLKNSLLTQIKKQDKLSGNRLEQETEIVSGNSYVIRDTPGQEEDTANELN